MNDLDEEVKRPGVMGFQIRHEEAIREEDLARLKAADDLTNMILSEMQYIGKLMGHRQIAPVEDLQQKIKAAYQRIEDYINRKGQALEEGEELQMEGEEKTGPEFDKHPLLPELGGMNLEWDKLDKDWMEKLGVDSKMLDKTELENKVKQKIRDKIQNTLKLANKMKNRIKNKPAFRPVQKQVNQLVARYKKALENTRKLVLEAPAPAPAPKYSPGYEPDKPRPKGFA